MALASMTGFARAQGSDQAGEWVWEVKSVNARGMDVRFRLPPGLDRLEARARTAISERFKRGTISASLSLAQAPAAEAYRINRQAVASLAAEARELAVEYGLAPPHIDALLCLRGIVEVGEGNDRGDPSEPREAALIETLDRALSGLAAMRREEGARLQAILLRQLDEAARLRDSAVGCAAAQPDALRQRLQRQLQELLAGLPGFSEDRLAQEAALLVARTDVREELDRFGAHLAAARELLHAGGAVGRRLDFLCQELSREANTLCSKSADLELTAIGLEIKVLVEQFREQVQNVE